MADTEIMRTESVQATSQPGAGNNRHSLHRLVGRLCRVFPRRTNATPTDELAYIGGPELWTEADAVHISVAFSWDIPEAERLEKEWRQVAPVTIGGPATGMRGDDFTPGVYLRQGYTITSRGCPNRCWFCSVWRRDGDVRELPIHDGYNVLDDNLLACSEQHIRAVFAMLGRQKRRPEFTGGLEAKRMQPWIAAELRKLKPESAYFAYDTADDLEPLQSAGQMLLDAGFTRTSHRMRCYVLCGYPKDTMEAATVRMNETLAAGFVPMAMLWRDKNGHRDRQWARFQRHYARPAITCSANAQVERRAPSTFAPTTGSRL